ncbi:MAG: glycosyltransferase family 4 protein [Anaerolineae bacterium]|nr:glycosyltransferase family 4 protein [Anaerolineae bacterium]
MNCVVAIEGRFVLKDGKPASHHLTYERFWKRYLEVFDSVTVLARLFSTEDPTAEPITGPGVTFSALPGYVGPEQYLLKFRSLKQHVHMICSEKASFILRVPGAVGSLVWRELDRRSYPFGVEVVGDPYDVFAPGAIKHPLRIFFRWWYARQLKLQCHNAVAVSYVTQNALQQRYSPSTKSFSTYYSSVQLVDDAFVDLPKTFPSALQKAHLVIIGSMERLYKAPDVLLRAMASCVREGLNLKLSVIGKGKFLPELQALAESLGIGAHVSFLGQLPAGAAVREKLDEADLFVLPSRQEGVPRAMLEAMARGLPCIGSTIGGIPELLPPEAMVPPNDVPALASKIREALSNADWMNQMAARNLQKAREYHEAILCERRNAMYAHLREATERWLHNHE